MAEKVKNLPEQEEKIDIVNGLVKSLKIFKKTWFLMILLVAIAGAVSLMYNRFLFVPEYQAYSTFTVSSGKEGYNSSYYSRLSLKQIGSTFPFILQSSTLKDVVAEELGMENLDAVEIEAKAVADSGFLWIGVKAGDPETAYNVLNSVIANYPSVAKYIIGDTVFTALDTSGLPTAPSNGVSDKNSVKRGALIGFVIYLLILISFTASRKTINSEEDLKQYTSVKCLASIPQVAIKRRSGNNKKLLLVDQKNVPAAFVEATSALRIRTKRRLEDDKKVMLITSTTEAEGKTTIASNLALSYALKGYKVLLIDADIRHPSISTAFGFGKTEGLISVLSGEKTFAEVVNHYGETSLDVLSGTESVLKASIPELLSSDNMHALIREARNKYDYVFLDTPPSGVMQDAAILASVCDCAVMVMRQDHLSRNQIVDNLEMLADTGIELIGYVINGESAGVGSYGYGRYGYGKYGYGKYGSKAYGSKK